MKQKLILTVCLCTILASLAKAELYFYEGFDYTADTRLQASETANKWTTGGNNPYPTNRLGNLFYSGLPDGTGNKLELGGSRTLYRGYAQRLVWNGVNTFTTNVFASFILNVESIGTVTNIVGGYVFSMCKDAAGRGYMQVSNNANNAANFNIALSDNADYGPWTWDTNGGNGYPANTPLLIVISYTNTAGSGWGQQLWVNPDTGLANPPASSITRASSAPPSVTPSNYAVSIGPGNSTTLAANRPVIFLDELRLGSSWTDVTPSGIKPYPILMDAEILPLRTNLFYTGDSGDIYIAVQNGNGITATNVAVQLTSVPSGFTVNTNYNNEYGTLLTSQTKTNTSPFHITAPLSGAVFDTPYVFLFTISGYDTNGISYSTNSSFSVLLQQAVSVSGQDSNDRFFLAANTSEIATNSLMIITNSSDAPVSCTFTGNQSWLSTATNLTISPHSASNLTMVAGPIPTQGQYIANLTASYTHTTTNFQNFVIQFDVGPKIEPVNTVVTNTGGVNLFSDKYEPGEILQVTVNSTNNGAITVNNITNVLILPAGWGTPSPVSAVYSSMVVGSSTSTLYTVTIPSGTDDGTYTCTVQNASGGLPWSADFTLDVFHQPIPSASTSLVFSVVQGRTNSASITLTNAGNANTTFSFSGGLSWVTNVPSSGTVTAQTSRTVSFVANATGQSIGTNSTTSYISWGNGDTSAVDVTMIVAPPPSVQYLSATTANVLIPGNTVDVYLTLTNSGTDASGVTAYVTPANSNFTVTANGAPASFGNINAGAVASNALPVKIKISLNTLPGTYTFNVTNIAAANGGSSSSGSFTLTVQPMLQYVTTTLSKSPMNAGETVNAYITATNVGNVTASYVKAYVSNTNAGFTIQSSLPVQIGTINPGNVRSNSFPLVIRADSTVLPGIYSFAITNITCNEGYAGEPSTFDIEIQAPVQYVGTTLSTNAILPGGAITAYIILTNSSGSVSDYVYATVSTTNTGFTIQNGSPAQFGTIAAGATRSNSFPVIIGCGITMPAGTYTFDLTDIGTASAKGYNASFTVSVTNTVFNLNVAVNGSSRILTWTKPVDGLSRLYTVYYTTNLVSGSWNVLAEILNEYSYTDNDPPIPARSYRVTVE